MAGQSDAKPSSRVGMGQRQKSEPHVDPKSGRQRRRTSISLASYNKPPVQLSSRLCWVASRHWDDEPTSFRKTSIICTLGPKTSTPEMITKLRQAGMNIVRMNFSHGDHDFHRGIIENVRESCRQTPGPLVALALDTKGPEIRLGDMKNKPGGVDIIAGQDLILTTDKAWFAEGDSTKVYIDYERIGALMEPGKLIYVDDGNLQLEVTSILEDNGGVVVKVINSHFLTSRKGVNLPSTAVDLPAVTARDKADLTFGAQQGVDMVFASFCRSAADIREIRAVLESATPDDPSRGRAIRIIAKIENAQGLDALDEIIREADGLMVARGDLGIEIPTQKVFIAQKSMIARCNMLGKPVICATQMLESMTKNPRPTRAEASDVANAVLDGADCVMLSGETASGNYPLETVRIMDAICREAEATIAHLVLFEEMRSLSLRDTSVAETIACSAVNASLEEYIDAILVITATGETATMLSKFRPKVPIIAATGDEHVARALHLHRGVYPVYIASLDEKKGHLPDSHDWMREVMDLAKKTNLIEPGDTVVTVNGANLSFASTNSLSIVKVD